MVVYRRTEGEGAAAAGVGGGGDGSATQRLTDSQCAGASQEAGSGGPGTPSVLRRYFLA